jgi:hypothetical protein
MRQSIHLFDLPFILVLAGISTMHSTSAEIPSHGQNNITNLLRKTLILVCGTRQLRFTQARLQLSWKLQQGFVFRTAFYVSYLREFDGCSS